MSARRLFRISATLLVLALVAPANAASGRLNGDDLLSACTHLDPDWIGFCHGYVQAVYDGVEVAERPICIPDGQTRADLVSLVVHHLERFPEMRELNAASVVYAVLYQRFPCP